MTIGAYLRKARLDNTPRLSMRKLAERLRVSSTYVYDIEAGRRRASDDMLRKLARELSLDADLLVAMSGRLPRAASEYMRAHPAAARLVVECAEREITDEVLERLLQDIGYSKDTETTAADH